MKTKQAPLYKRAFNILISPKAEWFIIQNERNEINALITGFVVPAVSLIALIAFTLRMAEAGFVSGIAHFTSIFITNIVSVVIASYILLELPRNFGGVTTLGTASAIVVYSSVPSWIATLLIAIHPSLHQLHWLGLYTYLIFYFGLNALIQIPEDKRVGFNVIAALILLLVNSLVGVAGKRILNAII